MPSNFILNHDTTQLITICNYYLWGAHGTYFKEHLKKDFIQKKCITATKGEHPTMHCEISSKLTIMIPGWCQLCRSAVFIVNCIFQTFSNVSIVDFEHVNIFWVACTFK